MGRQPEEVFRDLEKEVNVETGTPAKDWDQYLKLRKLLDELVLVQPALEFEDFPDHWAAFRRWLSERKYPLDDLPLDFTTGLGEGNGVVTTRDVQAGETVAVVHRSLMLTTDELATTPFANLVKEDPIIQAVPSLALALVVLYHLSLKNSSWKPYLDTLPRQFSIPLYYSVAEAESLRGSPVHHEITRITKNTTRQYIHVARLFEKNKKIAVPNFTYASFRWAVAISMTRQNQLPSQGSSTPVLGLIPVFDMCNYEPDGEITSNFNIESNSLEVQASRQVAKGEQFYIFYGPRSDADLLVYAGFVPSSNPHNTVKIKLGLSKDDPIARQRAQLLQLLSLPVSGEFGLGQDILHGNSSKPLVLFLQVFLLSPDQVKIVLEALQKELVTSPPAVTEVLNRFWTETNQASLKSFLKTRCSLLLRAYPTTIDDDVKLLQDKSLSQNMRNIVQLRLGEKQLFTRAISEL